ncbi:beta gamma crystallin protein [Diplodia corticola]|uniref:Beta gamma crystallin protein n=1 Tax=Diplodia corticola TaxID=236234 RepID=A0A1J9RP23_9PEZI|nr:beta gamma crystallin protein [Diplodia corticola]OJD30223.1 beta gamma crystallin protein [Diplodia corticola]
MKLTTAIFLTLNAAALTLAAPQSLGDTPTSPDTPSEFGPAYPVPDLGTDSPVAPSAAAAAADISARGWAPLPPKIRYCQHANGGGACKNQDIQQWSCYNFESYWNDRVSSIYVNPGWLCWLHADKNCNGRYAQFRAPGILDLGRGSGLNDQGSSFKCVPSQQ